MWEKIENKQKKAWLAHLKKQLSSQDYEFIEDNNHSSFSLYLTPTN